MKKIAIIIPSLNGGGAERIAGLLSQWLASYYQVYLFLLKREDVMYAHAGEIIYLKGDNLFFEYSLRENKKRYGIDCAISFMEPMNIANIRTQCGERVIISERTMQSLINPRHYAEDEKLRRYYNYADCVVACSYGVKQELEKIYDVNIPISVIYNYIDQVKIQRMSIEDISFDMKTFLGDSEFFIYLGRLHVEKNPERLIYQFLCFHEADSSETKLIIIGSGTLQKYIGEQITKYHLEEYIKVIPYMSNPFSYLARAKALILCSNYEGLPNVILEAMTLGCPVIATDCLSGPRELISDSSDYSALCNTMELCDRGILITNNQSENYGETRYMASAMKYMIDHPEYVSVVSYNQKEYMRKYSNEKIKDKWISVIEEDSSVGHNMLIEHEKKWIESFEHKVIFGTGYAGRSIYESLRSLYAFEIFLTDSEESLGMIDEIPICKIDDYCGDPHKTVVLIGAGDRGQDEAFKRLKCKGFEHLLFPYVNLAKCHQFSLDDIVEIIREKYALQAIVIGAGTYGKELVKALGDKGVRVNCVYDTNPDLFGKEIEKVPIVPFGCLSEKYLYLISLYDADNKEIWVRKLLENKIPYEDILCFHL